MQHNDPSFQRAIHLIDTANAADPHRETWRGEEHPKELLYSQRMSERLAVFLPDASEALRLAARAQHIRRWTHPRSAYPMDRAGYHRWRTELKLFHAQQAGDILEEVGYDDDTIDRVQSLILKKRMRTDPESQALEDVVCLVFLEHYFLDFAQQHPEEKVIDILRKTWGKMSEAGQRAALELPLVAEARALVERALAGV